jgi:hypothetical protein
MPSSSMLSVTEAARERVPVKSLDGLARVCDPSLPLDPDRDAALRIDVTKSRPSEHLGVIVPNVRRGGSTWTRWLISGHEGTGKTSDLRLLARVLETVQHEDTRDGKRVKFPQAEVLFVDASPVVAPTRAIDVTDVLLSIWAALDDAHWAAARDVLHETWKKQVESSLSKLVKNWPSTLGAAIAHLAPWLRGMEASELAVQQQVQRLEHVFVKGLNKAFETFRGTNKIGNVVVIIDNLEKIANRGAEARNIVSLFANRVGSLKSIDAHIILTIPIALAYSSDLRTVSNALNAELFTVPHVRVRARHGRPDTDADDGLSALASFVRRRVDVDTLFEDPPAMLRAVAVASGGNFRDLLRILHSAQTRAVARGAGKLTLNDIERAITRTVQQLETQGLERYSDVLAAVDREQQRPKICDDGTWFDLLAKLYVLEHADDEGTFYVVHPLVRQTRAVAGAPR